MCRMDKRSKLAVLRAVGGDERRTQRARGLTLVSRMPSGCYHGSWGPPIAFAGFALRLTLSVPWVTPRSTKCPTVTARRTQSWTRAPLLLDLPSEGVNEIFP